MAALAPAPALKAALEETLALVPQPRTTAGAGNADPFFRLVTRTLRNAVAAIVQDEQTYKIEGSVGRGNWAETPWVSAFDLSITDSATRGVYLVYLIREDGTRVYLSLNQGCTTVRRRERRRYREALEEYARLYASLLPAEELTDLLTGPIALGEGRTDLTPGYESGNIAAIAYDREAVPDNDTLTADLRRMLELYDLFADEYHLLQTGDLDATVSSRPTTAPPLDPPLLLETRRFAMHRRAEGRNRRAAQAAKAAQGYRCQVCDEDYEARLGPIGRGLLDAHHLVPFAELDEQPKRLHPIEDFAIVCATCHRLLHSVRPPLTIEAARTLMHRAA